ncbi:phosphoenolpyruvate--protein phosphotransferase [Denitrobacterium detoxificans]|jgi:phosphotransferase system enzyme I (PtsI)|uniref:phosphoenolpyruvate--protein phosphotransferase n=1 Tax=Denitrobacterium detoxificans TaxID=79604 RepID=UPI0026EE4530|nr:phosphoenolpyruvate--protein phosphotransferase [Denitrobacterium detoxificans]MBE6466627.1 phosphoenolpyruvate--protein phosphotransferase [Denitrobacterium detoxificans]
MELKGIAASAGLGIGTVVIIEEPSLEYASHAVDDTAAEAERLKAAIASYIEYTNAQADAVRESVGAKEAEILTGHVAMINDPYMQGEMVKLVDGGSCAEDALVQICDMFANMFEATGDELTMQRATDVRDVKTGVLAELLGQRPVDMGALPTGSVVVTHDLTPSMTAGIRPGTVVGFVTETGGLTSHSAILARAMEIPAVLSVPDACSQLAAGMQVIVDGGAGSVAVSPSAEELEAARAEQERLLAERAELAKFIGVSTVAASGEQFELFANIGKPDDATQAMERDAEGIGLFRTEFLFMDAMSMPTEDEQFEAYKKVALICKGKPVIVRTLDVGGDKEIGYLGFEREDNPFMGYRAIRYCLSNEDMYRAQLRAILRASAFGEVRIMVPFVTCVDEIVAVKALVKRYMQELDAEGVAYDANIQVGVMVETPAAALVADLLAQEADFFSIGTNDLTGYTMCADRGNDKVRYLYSTYNPAVLRSIRRVIECGNAAGIQVGMCGEAAADPLLVPLWIAFGLGEYSVSATSVLATRKSISLWSKEDACALAEKAMQLKTATEVYDLLRESAR